MLKERKRIGILKYTEGAIKIGDWRDREPSSSMCK